MPIIIDEKKSVLVQGITGQDGRASTKLMKASGTNVVVGCTPGMGGESVEDIPAYDTVLEAMNYAKSYFDEPVEISVVFGPAPLVKDAAIEAIEAGVRTLVLVPDRVPAPDAMAIHTAAKANGARFIGPNSLGVLSPGRAMVGVIDARGENDRVSIPSGPVGLVSRFGDLALSHGRALGEIGVGLSTLVHVGSDHEVGLRIPEVAILFEDDPETKALVVIGEAGGSQEERLAELIRDERVTKPVIACVRGADDKTHEGKIRALRDSGATVVTSPGELAAATLEVMRNLGIEGTAENTERD
ncbi:MAG: CoA-binding protein [Phycisphaerales bacterium]